MYSDERVDEWMVYRRDDEMTAFGKGMGKKGLNES